MSYERAPSVSEAVSTSIAKAQFSGEGSADSSAMLKIKEVASGVLCFSVRVVVCWKPCFTSRSQTFFVSVATKIAGIPWEPAILQARTPGDNHTHPGTNGFPDEQVMNKYCLGDGASPNNSRTWAKFADVITAIRATPMIKFDDIVPDAYKVVFRVLLPFFQNYTACATFIGSVLDKDLKLADAAPIVSKFKALSFQEQDFHDLKACQLDTPAPQAQRLAHVGL